MPANCDRARLATQPELARPAAAWVAHRRRCAQAGRPSPPHGELGRRASRMGDGGIRNPPGRPRPTTSGYSRRFFISL
jgi:hypothetical protein